MLKARPTTSALLLLLICLLQDSLAMYCHPKGSTVDGTGSVKPLVCIGAHDLGSGSTQFTLFSAAGGWLGFGLSSVVGDFMGPADVMVAYLDGSNAVKVTSFLTTGAGALASNPAKPWTQVALNTTIPQPSWAPIAVSVTKPNAASGAGGVAINIGKTSNFIFAWAATKVTITSSGAIGMTPHGTNHTGVAAKVNSGSSSIVPLPDGFSLNTVVLAHAAIMIFALVLMPPVGAFVAMFMREKLRTGWLSVHLGIMIGGVTLMAIIGGVVMVLYNPGPHLGSIHQIAGVAIITLLLIQIGLGFGARSASDSKSVLAQVHKYSGLTITYLLVPVQLYLGFTEYNTQFNEMAPMWLIAAAGVCALAGIGLLVAGYFLLPYGEPGLRGLSTGGLGSTAGAGYHDQYQKSRQDFVELDGYGPEAHYRGGGSRNGATSANGRSGSRGQAMGAVSGNGRSANDHYGGSVANDYYAGAVPTSGNNDYYYAPAAPAAPMAGNDYYGGGGVAAAPATPAPGFGAGGADYNYSSQPARDPSRDYNASRKAPSRNAAGGGVASSNGHYDAVTPTSSTRGGGNYPGTTPARNPSRTRRPIDHQQQSQTRSHNRAGGPDYY